MITKLPRWVEYGAFLLALLAGTVNAIGLLGFQHQAVSHISGTVTLLGTSIEALNAQTTHQTELKDEQTHLLKKVSFLINQSMTFYYKQITICQNMFADIR